MTRNGGILGTEETPSKGLRISKRATIHLFRAVVPEASHGFDRVGRS